MSVRVPFMVAGLAGLAIAAAIPTASAAPSGSSGSTPGASRADEVAAYWTPARRAAAIPRDLALDDQGRGHIRGANGTWIPYGGRTITVDPVLTSSDAEVSSKPTPMGKPTGGSSDKLAPVVSGRDPGPDANIGTAYTFKATVTDELGGSGVRSVSFALTYPSGTKRSYSASKAGDVYSVSFSGFTAGSWAWSVTAKDNAGNTRTDAATSFTVGSSTGTGVIAKASWSGGGTVQTAAGRIYFEMPGTSGTLAGYVCSGTAVTDASGNAVSTILTAAHCVYDDADKVFAKNVLFIPNQSASGTKTDTDCSNDVMGCWVPAFGVVDKNYTGTTFPGNNAWDYAFYVVPTTGAHVGKAVADESLEVVSKTLPVPFSDPTIGSPAQAMGYSYADDPKFMYCSENLSTTGTVNWWLSQCGLTGGSSGGPWLQPANAGEGPVMSVNSWGYTTKPGMAGPKLNGTSARCIFTAAQTAADPGAPEGIAVEVANPATC